MPAALEAKLRKEAAAKGYTGKRADSYVYGSLNNMGMMRGSKETAKGRAYDRKHTAAGKALHGR